MALCNIAAASHDQGRSLGDLPEAEASAIAMLELPRGSDGEESKTASIPECTSELAESKGSDGPTEGAGCGIPTAVDVRKNKYKKSCWLRSTDILPKIISGGLVRATGEVKGNLLRAMNNLMCSPRRRAEIVNGQQMANLFELVHGYTDEVRDSKSANAMHCPDS